MSRFNLPDTGIQSGQQQYHAVLLRYWREDETVAWRYLVQDLATGEEYGFANLDLLIAFLYQHMERQNAGVDMGIVQDLDRMSRPQGAGVDMGAYESQHEPQTAQYDIYLPLVEQ